MRLALEIYGCSALAVFCMNVLLAKRAWLRDPVWWVAGTIIAAFWPVAVFVIYFHKSSKGAA